MNRPRSKVSPLVAIFGIIGIALLALCVLVIAFVYFRKELAGYTSTNQSECRVEHVRFDPLYPELAALASPDQQAVLAVDGLPQAFTLYVDPRSGAIVEEWDYFTTGRELIFLDGVYQGGTEVPQPEIAPGADLPELAVYPWEIKGELTPACVVELTGTALFATSALVLPGWNDGYEIARQWMLAGGGNMITVDGHLAMLSIDPGVATDLDQFKITDFLVGTLGEGENRLGAILSPGAQNGGYRLSLSPRGQGTTQDGTELVLDLQGSRLVCEYALGTDGRAILVDLEGNEREVLANGTLKIDRQGDAYQVHFDGWVSDRDYSISGMLGNGLWKSGDSSPVQAIGEAVPYVPRPETALQPAGSPTEQAVPAPTPTTASAAPTLPSQEPPSEPEVDTEWRTILDETFVANTNNWPVQWTSDDESIYFQSDLFQEQYLIFAERKQGTRPFVQRTIDYGVGSRFIINVDTKQEGDANSDCGLIVATQDDTDIIWFAIDALDGKFSVLRSDEGGNWTTLIDWTASPAILSGQANQLSITGNNSTNFFFVNNQAVGLRQGSGMDVQKLGLAASVGSDTPVTCYFDNLMVRVK
jgi:hypothetical protein